MSQVSAVMVAAGRVLGEPRLSPDGAVVAFVATAAGRSVLVVVPAAGGPELVLTTDPPPNSARADGGGVFDWLPDGTGLLYAAADGGLWLQEATGGPPRSVVVAGDEGPAGAPAVSPDGSRVAYVVDQHRVVVAPIDPSAADAVELTDGADFAFDPTWSLDGGAVAWHEWDVPAMPWDSSRIVVRSADASTPARLVAGGEGIAVSQPRFGPDGRLGYLCDEEGGWLNLWVAQADGSDPRPLVTASTELGGPSWGQGVRTWCWSPDATEVVWRTNDDGYSRLQRGGGVGAPAPEAGGTTVARGVHHSLSWRGTTLAAVRTGARTPTQVVVYDLAVTSSGPEPARRTLAGGPVAGWEALDLPEPEVLRWRGDDGGEVVGRLSLPPNVDRPPLLCWIHGGPTDQWPVTFNARHAYFVQQGWAILVPDHRGSTGHGRAYTQAMAGRWGELDVDDCAAGIRHVTGAGLVDADRVVPIGSSAGGFTALLLLARQPDLCAAGVALSAVADLVDLAERSHRFEAHYTHSLVGPLPGSHAEHVRRSPLRCVDSITAPVLLLHGDADLVVPVDQARALAAALEELGRTVELHVYEGEGHGWGRPDVVVDELTRIEAFLARHAGTGPEPKV